MNMNILFINNYYAKIKCINVVIKSFGDIECNGINYNIFTL